MTGAKACNTPLSTYVCFSLHVGTTTVDDSEFKKLVDSLQYITLTRSGICYAVKRFSQFMHKPTSTHMQALKRVLRYLKVTCTHS